MPLRPRLLSGLLLTALTLPAMAKDWAHLPKPNPLAMPAEDLLDYAAWLTQGWGPLSGNSVLVMAVDDPASPLSEADRLRVRQRIAENYRRLEQANEQNPGTQLARPRLEAIWARIRAGDYAGAEKLLTALDQTLQDRQQHKLPLGSARAESLLARSYLGWLHNAYRPAIDPALQALGALGEGNHMSLLEAGLLAQARARMLDGSFFAAKTLVDMLQTYAEDNLNHVQLIAALGLQGELALHWGKTDEAKEVLLRAQGLAEETHDAAELEVTLLLAKACLESHQPQQARQWLLRAEPLSARTPDVFGRHLGELRKGQILLGLNQAAEAEACFEAARQGFRALGLTAWEIQALAGLSHSHQSLGQEDRALADMQELIQQGQTALTGTQLWTYYTQLGWLQLARGEYQAAVTAFETAERTPLDVSAADEALRESTEQRMRSRQGLVKGYLALNQVRQAFEASENAKNGVFLEQLRGRGGLNGIYLNPAPPSSYDNENEVKHIVPEGTLALSFTQTDAQEMGVFAIQHRSAAARPLNLAKALAAQPLYRKYAQKLRLEGPQGPDFTRLAQVYRQLLSDPDADAATTGDLGRLLFEVLLAPDANRLAASRTLLVIPDGALGLIPFETLRDRTGQYLVAHHDIQYVQSFETLAALQARNYTAARPMLAFGEAGYQPQSYAQPPIESEVELLNLKRRVWSFPQAPMREIYGALYAPQWTPLPGSHTELTAIARLLPEASLHTGAAVDEAAIKHLSASGELAQFRLLHWAVHGLVVPEIPELSALVLSQPPATEEDNYLRMPEIAALKLQAELVNLSACETGLGKIFRGDGIVGLTQAFMTAGANRVAVSLWQIDDRASARFMETFYQGLGHGSAFRQQLNQTKRAFLTGQFGQRYTHPAYWAPFVLYGRL